MKPGRRLLRLVRQQFWTEEGEGPDWSFAEIYDYDWQGRRIAKVHCADAENITGGDWEQICRQTNIEFTYDYDGAQVIGERRMPALDDLDEKDRYQSSYVWGPMGLITRVAEANTLCTDDNCGFDYLLDASGNCHAVIPQSQATAPPDLIRMDAFGNTIEPLFSQPTQSVLPVADADCDTNGCADDNPEEVLCGPYQYHGSDRYECDVADPNRGQSEPEMGRSTGFVHCGVRYYEPATGRFLQHDPLPLDPTPLAWGQHNRWTYAANDPLTNVDVDGLLVFFPAAVAIGAAFAFSAGFLLAWWYVDNNPNATQAGLWQTFLAFILDFAISLGLERCLMLGLRAWLAKIAAAAAAAGPGAAASIPLSGQFLIGGSILLTAFVLGAIAAIMFHEAITYRDNSKRDPLFPVRDSLDKEVADTMYAHTDRCGGAFSTVRLHNLLPSGGANASMDIIVSGIT